MVFDLGENLANIRSLHATNAKLRVA